MEQDNPTPPILSGNEKRLAQARNTRRNNAHKLKKGGGKPRKELKAQELRFCAHYAKSRSVLKAAIYAGYKFPNSCYELTRREAIKAQIAEETERNLAMIREEVDVAFAIDTEVVDATMMHILVNGKHEIARAKVGDSIYQRLGLINRGSSASATAAAGAAAQVVVDIKAQRLFLPDWRKEAIDAVKNGEQCTSNGEVQTSK